VADLQLSASASHVDEKEFGDFITEKLKGTIS